MYDDHKLLDLRRILIFSFVSGNFTFEYSSRDPENLDHLTQNKFDVITSQACCFHWKTAKKNCALKFLNTLQRLTEDDLWQAKILDSFCRNLQAVNITLTTKLHTQHNAVHLSLWIYEFINQNLWKTLDQQFSNSTCQSDRQMCI